jgi:hypothetical protein
MMNKLRKAFSAYSSFAKENSYRTYRQARKWSNQELRKFSSKFSGEIINVSGWEDSDKEGNTYKNYFTDASSYTISNYSGERGSSGNAGEIYIDLASPLDNKYAKNFDVVFNHTTLEHVFEIDIAFSNLCSLSRDIVILVLPFLQPTHVTSSYGDYWRFTPQGIQKLFEKNGFEIIYESASEDYYSAVYLFFVASCDPKKWKESLPSTRLPVLDVGSNAFGHPPFMRRLLRWFGNLLDH